jgi:hypothetical protein
MTAIQFISWSKVSGRVQVFIQNRTPSILYVTHLQFEVALWRAQLIDPTSITSGERHRQKIGGNFFRHGRRAVATLMLQSRSFRHRSMSIRLLVRRNICLDRLT